jgi:NADH-quinone oxidoreductase subunit L
VLAVLAVLSAVGGWYALPHFLEPLLALPEPRAGTETLQATLIGVAIAVAFAGLAGATYFYGGDGTRAERARRALPRLHRLLAGKYFVDEAYERLLHRPLLWVSDRVFLRLGDRRLLDGSLDGLAALGRRSAAALARIQTGSLHVYAFLVLLGVAGVVVWSWRHG